MTRQAAVVWTIGHSTRSLDELAALLRENSVQHLVDIRTMPRSRHNPQFNTDTLPASLAARGLAYTHLSALGGLRHTRKDSINTGWRNASFRGYADYMQTPEFAAALEELMRVAQAQSTVIMCAEAVPWRCHRSLVADALTVHGFDVRHIMGQGKWHSHKLTPFAHIDGVHVTYPVSLQE
ncbi:MAG: DUF488 domain-containing protein [Gammaproteobacteria bacterium]|nr:DUF488 domain-containing protein [Gammaproteobacteria bacterium]MBU6509357.1 DUF488 domain-containing protein [Gammaproteobacteria bacterium]MDE1983568.1 DUF488 domain-containing protein [Gammaproteobacteria bacterium]MDE2461622.1 DUF488 domain-containing protein [Gammaproteobacteria bacterium]